ncbi:MAG: thymidine kinase, partial [Chitinophagales bacterium]|nr:thymidine kinase [Chitinophagales bacterium]
MFSGKTEELIRRLRRSIIANRKVGIFKPHIDTRYSISHVVSHDKTAIPSTVVSNSESLFILAQNYEVIG